MTGGEEGAFLSRWSRRKRAVEPAPEPDAAAEPDAAELAANRAAAEAVDLDALDRHSDLSTFLKKGVPVLLRQRAMAALWRSDPLYANLDGMVDYGEDYGRKELLMPALKSAWVAGRGYAKALSAEAEGARPPGDTPGDPPGGLPPGGPPIEEPAPEPDLPPDPPPADVPPEIPPGPPEDLPGDVPNTPPLDPPQLSLRHRLSLGRA